MILFGTTSIVSPLVSLLIYITLFAVEVVCTSLAGKQWLIVKNCMTFKNKNFLFGQFFSATQFSMPAKKYFFFAMDLYCVKNQVYVNFKTTKQDKKGPISNSDKKNKSFFWSLTSEKRSTLVKSRG